MLSEKELSTIVNRYRKDLEKKIEVKKIILYGSYAYGKPRKGSDIDLIVISPDFKKISPLKRLEFLSLARLKTLDPIEAIGYTPEEFKDCDKSIFLGPAVKRGKVVFER